MLSIIALLGSGAVFLLSAKFYQEVQTATSMIEDIRKLAEKKLGKEAVAEAKGETPKETKSEFGINEFTIDEEEPL